MDLPLQITWRGVAHSARRRLQDFARGQRDAA